MWRAVVFPWCRSVSPPRRTGALSPGILVPMPTALREGDQALILDGPFAGKVGTITRIDSDSATVLCDVFDRDTPINVDLDDVATPPSPGTSGDREPRSPPPSAGSTGGTAETH
jgi:hypothetical protein